jgi:hypothetical protein
MDLIDVDDFDTEDLMAGVRPAAKSGPLRQIA